MNKEEIGQKIEEEVRECESLDEIIVVLKKYLKIINDHERKNDTRRLL